MKKVEYNQTDVGRRLRELRIANGMTQVKLSEELHISADSVSGFEKGKTTISPEYMTIICQLFNVSADNLLFGHNKALDRKKEDINSGIWSELFAKMSYDERKRAIAIMKNVFPQYF